MTGRHGLAVSLVAWGFGLGSAARAEEPASKEGAAARSTMALHVSGKFDVKLVPQGAEDKAEGATLGRLSVDKHYRGALEATGQGQMLTAVTDVKGSAGYVAIERVTGTLDGRAGSFVLQHSGTMSTAGGPQLSITVVPDSGSGQLRGIVGKLSVRIVDGQHFYDFEYTLP